MPDQTVDLLVIGGGINGAAVARDAAGRGLKVMLAEKNDYACGTSSASSNLIHGGLRYLETFDFKLVWEALGERDKLMHAAPHLVRPLRFLIPVYQKQRRPAWVIRSALKLYDLLGGKTSLAPSGMLSSNEIAQLSRLRKKDLKCVLHYWDCQTEDSRLVIANLLDARSRGADIGNRRDVEKISPIENGYRIEIRDNEVRREVDARFVVNASGPWANKVLDLCSEPGPKRQLRLVRGSHAVLKVPGCSINDAYTLQARDGRVVFTLPWHQPQQLVVGTTEILHSNDLESVRCNQEELRYLLETYNRYFANMGGDLLSSDVVWTWAGVRPLVEDGAGNLSKISRESELVCKANGTGGLVTIYGGKLTSHRILAENVMETLAKTGATLAKHWTADAVLYGGSLSRDELEELCSGGPDLVSLETRHRWINSYGDRTQAIYDIISDAPETVREIAPGIPEAELKFSQQEEDTRTAEDFLLRRTKLYSALQPSEKTAVKSWFGR